MTPPRDSGDVPETQDMAPHRPAGPGARSVADTPDADLHDIDAQRAMLQDVRNLHNRITLELHETRRSVHTGCGPVRSLLENMNALARQAASFQDNHVAGDGIRQLDTLVHRMTREAKRLNAYVERQARTTNDSLGSEHYDRCWEQINHYAEQLRAALQERHDELAAPRGEPKERSLSHAGSNLDSMIAAYETQIPAADTLDHALVNVLENRQDELSTRKLAAADRLAALTLATKLRPARRWFTTAITSAQSTTSDPRQG